eukprot:5896990-Alexandrium_andersonii.AAC.1
MCIRDSPWPTPPPGWNEYLQAWSQQQHLAAREGAPQAPVGASPRRVFAGSPDDANVGRGRSPALPDRSPAGRRSPAPGSPPPSSGPPGRRPSSPAGGKAASAPRSPAASGVAPRTPDAGGP